MTRPFLRFGHRTAQPPHKSLAWPALDDRYAGHSRPGWCRGARSDALSATERAEPAASSTGVVTLGSMRTSVG